MNKELPVNIVITSFNRVALLEKTIDLINERTFFPYRIVVVDNHSTDGSVEFLKAAKVHGRIFDHLFLPENVGQSRALNAAFASIEAWENDKRRPSNDFMVTSNEDIFPPMLGQDRCWLARMIDILQRHEPEYGGLCMRIQRTPRNNIDESKEIIPCYKGFPSVFRLMRRSDLRTLGDRPFGRLMKWDSNTMGEKYKTEIRKKFGFTTKIYADHAGFMTENRGYEEGFTDYFTYAENKVTIHKEKPYPDIDPLTNVPIKINHPYDAAEHELRVKASQNNPARVTVIILTYKRPAGLDRMVRSVLEKTTDIPYQLLVVVDNDDTEAYNYCVDHNIPCILVNFHRDFVAQANLAIYACETPYFAILSDDTEIIEATWLKRSMDVFEEKFPDQIGMLPFNDGIQNGKLFTMGLSSKKFVEFMGGHMYYPGYKHYGGDREVSRIAKEKGLYYYDPSIEVAHHHHCKTGEAKDETYLNSENKFWQYDQRLKRERRDNPDLMSKRNYYEY